LVVVIEGRRRRIGLAKSAAVSTGLFWFSGVFLVAGCETLGLNRHNVLGLRWHLLWTLFVVVGLIAALVTWVRYKRRSLDPTDESRLYLLWRTNRFLWTIRAIGAALFYSVATSILCYYLALLAVDWSSSSITTRRAQVIRIAKASNNSVCYEYVDLLFSRDDVTSVCSRQKRGRRDLWRSASTVAIGDQVTVVVRSGRFGSVVDSFFPAMEN
jgi:hypothetical protein